MAWPTPPKTWGSEPDTSADRNAQIRDALRELWHVVAYIEFTSGNTPGGSPADVVSAGAITYGGFPIIVEFFVPRVSNIATGGIRFTLLEDAAQKGIILETGDGTTSGIDVHSFGVVARQYTPSAGSHTIKVQAAKNGTTGASYSAGAGDALGTLVPGFIRILEKGGA